MNHIFDWQKEDHGVSNSSFLGWLLPHLFVFADDDIIEKISDKSDKFTKVDIGITVNGEPVDALAFIENLEKVIMNQTAYEVKESLNNLQYLSELEDEIGRLKTVIGRAAENAADKLGVELSSWD